MLSERITIRISRSLAERLRNHVEVGGRSEAAIVRVALESYLALHRSHASAYDLANVAGLIGCVKAGQPSDLSVNREHLEGFGLRT
jgi:predicted DNA-binding protein